MNKQERPDKGHYTPGCSRHSPLSQPACVTPGDCNPFVQSHRARRHKSQHTPSYKDALSNHAMTHLCHKALKPGLVWPHGHPHSRPDHLRQIRACVVGLWWGHSGGRCWGGHGRVVTVWVSVGSNCAWFQPPVRSWWPRMQMKGPEDAAPDHVKYTGSSSAKTTAL